MLAFVLTAFADRWRGERAGKKIAPLALIRIAVVDIPSAPSRLRDETPV
jgi:hypothetical protein